MFRFLHAADIHLDSPLRGLSASDDTFVDEIRGAGRRAFDRLVELAIDEAVAFVLIAGDLFDGDWKDYNSGLYFAGRMGRLTQAGIRVFIVSGNHDAASQITKAMPLPAGVTFFSVKRPQSHVIEELGVVIHGQGHVSRAVVDNLATSFPARQPHYFNIGLLHTALNGRPGHEPYAPCSPADLRAKGYDYWALGHVHEREIVGDAPAIVFSGCLQGRHIRETGDKGATLVTVDDGRIMTVEHRSLAVVRWLSCLIDLTGCTTLDGFFAMVGERLQREQALVQGQSLAVRLQFHGATTIHSLLVADPVRWSAELSGLAVGLGGLWLEKILFATCRPASVDAALAGSTSLVGLLGSLENLEEASHDLFELTPELEQLKVRLPPELDVHSIFPGEDIERRRELLAAARELLLARLVRQQEDGS